MKVRALLRDKRAASAAEFAMVLPLFIILLFGIIDAGRYMWTINRAEKAAQMGVRMAVVTDYVTSSIGNDYIGQCTTPLGQGDPIPADCFSTITCSKPSNSVACSAGTADADAFDTVLARMRLFMPEIEGGNVQLIYSPSGLGYAGDPNGPDLAPLVTVRLSGLTFNPIITLAFATVGIPEVRSSLTFEDGVGSASN
jgi:Flp pilus assembly protein TadG